MKTDNNIDIINESLDAANEYANLLFHTNSVHKESCQQDFKAGANWQAKKDKAIIDKLTGLLTELSIAVSFLDTVDTRTAEANKKANYFLNQLKETK